MKKILYSLVILLAGSPVYAKVLSYDDLQNSVCRIKTTVSEMSPLFGTRIVGGYGTGTVFLEDEQFFYILTNGHVTNAQNAKYTAEFVHEGEFRSPVPVELQWQFFRTNTSIDAAILRLNKVNVAADQIIQPIKIAPSTTQVQGNIIWGGGFPDSRWLQFWRAKVLSVDNPNIYKISMPPVEGQSGSAVLLNIADETYIVGLVTWRFENNANNYGGAVSLIRLHDMFNGSPQIDRINVNHSYTNVSGDEGNQICNGCGRPKNEHLLVYDKDSKEYIKKSDGRILLYCPNHADIPLQHNQDICEWKVRPYPPGVKPPQTPRPNAPNGPIGNLPPGIVNPPQPPVPQEDWSEKVKTLQDENTALKIENQDLKKRLDNCVSEKSNTISLGEHTKQIAERERKIAELEAKIAAAGLPNSGLDAQVKIWKDEIDRLRAENLLDKEKFVSQDKLIAGLRLENEKLKSGKTVLENDIANLKAENGQHMLTIEQHSTKINELLAQIEQLTQGLPPDRWNNPIASGPTTKITLALLLGFILSKLTPLIKAKFGNVVGGIIVWAIRKGGKKVLGNKIDDTPTQTTPPLMPVVIETAVQVPEKEIPVSSNIRQFIQMKEKDGEDINKLAIFGVLYKEAVEKLRKGEFNAKNGSPLLSQHKTADTLEEWVVEQFYKTTTIDQIKNQDELHREAMYGFLYQQAFAALRQGKLHVGVLNHVEIADAVDKWVKKEYLRRLKVN